MKFQTKTPQKINANTLTSSEVSRDINNYSNDIDANVEKILSFSSNLEDRFSEVEEEYNRIELHLERTQSLTAPSLEEIQENIFSVRQIVKEIDVLLVDSRDFFVEEVNPVSFEFVIISICI